MANSVDQDHLASLKPTDLDLHCLQRQDMSGFSRTRVNLSWGTAFPTRLHVCPVKTGQPAHMCSLIRVFAGHLWVAKDTKYF